MIPKLTIRTVLWLATTAALLFIPAHTTHWPSAWMMLAELGILALSIGLWLATHDPQLLRDGDVGHELEFDVGFADRGGAGPIVREPRPAGLLAPPRASAQRESLHGG